MSFLLESSDIVSQGLVFRNAPEDWVVWLVIIPAIFAFTIFFYRMGREGSPLVRAVLTGLRVLVLLFVIALLMDPAMKSQVIEHKPTLGVIMVDVSASMDHKDDYTSSPDLAAAVRHAAELPSGAPLDSWSRFDLARRVLTRGDQPLLLKLARERRLRIFSFGERLQGVAGIEDLEPRDRVTALGTALLRVLDEPEVKSVPVGGIVVISDGKNTTGPSPEAAAELAVKRRIRIHAVGVGDPRALQDVELVSVSHSSVVLLDDTMALDIAVRHKGFAGRQVELRLLEGGQPLHRQREVLLATEQDQTFRMLYRPVREGSHQWTVEVRPLPGEHTYDNNRRAIEVTVKRMRLRVLYVDTLPRWEYRKLKDFLTRAQEAFVAQCYLLEADRGFRQESTMSVEPLRAFPDNEEDLFRYDVLIFGDVDPERLGEFDPARTRRILELIKRFVEDGGGFVMVAGDRFAPLAYKDTPVGEIVPVVVDPTLDSIPGGDNMAGFKVKLTELGRRHPVMQLHQDQERNGRIWEKRTDKLSLKEMYWYARVKKAKPGAAVLAVHESDRNEHGLYPLIVAGTYGEGPVLFIAFDETWRWYWWQGPYLHHRFWGNVVRHLARTRLYKGNKRFKLMSNLSEYHAGDRVTLRANVRDRTYRPAEKEEQVVILQHPKETGKQDEVLKLRKTEPGWYERSFVASETGTYRAWIPPEEGLSDEKVSPISFLVKISDAESRDPVLDEPALKKLARTTRGRYVSLADAEELIQEVARGSVEIPRQDRYTHLREKESPWLRWLPALFLALLAVEWTLRKRFRFL